VKTIRRPSFETWEHVASKCTYATFFHTPTWAQIVAETFAEFHIYTMGFLLDDGVIAIVPLVGTVEQNRYFKWYESMFPGGYGGAVAERDLTAHELDDIFRRLARTDAAYLHVMGNPYVDQNLPPTYRRTQQYTHLLDLAAGWEAISGHYSSTKKRYIRKAVKMGVTISVAQTEQEFRDYYRVYEDTLRRWGTGTLNQYPYRLFEQIYRRRSEATKLWVAKVNGEIVSGNLILYHNQNASYWHGATLEDYFDYHPAPLLMNEIICDACQIGLRYYDLGPSGGLEGVERFKEEFGAQRRYFSSYIWDRNRLYRAYRSLRYLRAPGPEAGQESAEQAALTQPATRPGERG
jgi:hypothetical protein